MGSLATTILCALISVEASAQLPIPGHPYAPPQPGERPTRYPQNGPGGYPRPSLPATAPTAAAAPVQPATAVATPVSAPIQPLAAPTTPAHRADVTYSAGQLSVAASNSSLNQILREISHQTGMKITGGVTDERVFGTYGPAAPATILAALLDGTGSNMLLRQSPADPTQEAKPPVELVLTPRRGGPTPPNPNAAGFGDNADGREPDVRQDDSALRSAAAQQTSAPADPDRPAVPTALPAPTDTPTDDKSSNGIKTPQQIYEQLLRLRQQQTTPAPQ
jgi:hypothetical protein